MPIHKPMSPTGGPTPMQGCRYPAPNPNYKIPVPPIGGPVTESSFPDIEPAETKKKCEHQWVFQCSDYKMERGTYNSEYSRIDTYYCEKCCEQKEIVAKQDCCREWPYWYHK